VDSVLTLMRWSAASMLAIDTESRDMEAAAGSDHVAAGTSAVGRDDVNNRLPCRGEVV
jgi:hypothetical protein